eukprot:scpid56365/ scgid27733/ 
MRNFTPRCSVFLTVKHCSERCMSPSLIHVSLWPQNQFQLFVLQCYEYDAHQQKLDSSPEDVYGSCCVLASDNVLGQYVKTSKLVFICSSFFRNSDVARVYVRRRSLI